MKRINFKKFLIIFCVGLFFLLNTVFFGNSSICFAKDHISLEISGFDSCCQSQHESLNNNDTGIKSPIFTKKSEKAIENNSDHCIDQKIILSDSEENKISLKTNIKSTIISILNVYLNSFDYNKIIVSNFINKIGPAVNYNLNRLNTVILLI